MKVNDNVELVVCDTFSKGCFWSDLEPPLPRLRHYDNSVELQSYVLPGANSLTIEYLPDGEAETLYFTVVRIENGREVTLAEGKIVPDVPEPVTVEFETPAGCTTPPLPSQEWLVDFLDPLPEATRTFDDNLYARMLVPPTTAQQADVRARNLALVRSLNFPNIPNIPPTLQQDHRDVRLAMNYSCENQRLFVYPEDGGDLFIYTRIDRNPDGNSARWSASRYAELVYHDNRWYLGTPQSP